MLTKKSMQLIDKISQTPFFQEWPMDGLQSPFLLDLVKKIQRIDLQWPRAQERILASKTAHIHTPEMNHFPPAILESLQTGHWKYSYLLPTKRNVHVHFIQKRPPAETVLHKLYLWFSLLDFYMVPDCSVEMDVVLFLSSHLKLLPNPAEKLGREHSNTAFTTECRRKTAIYIYRREEWFKVLIHETFHSVGLVAFTPAMNQRANTVLRGLFHMRADILFYETYCEIWATILNCLFYSLSSSKVLQTLETCLAYESCFSLMQTNKILRHNQLTYRHMLSHTNAYTEDTNVFAYYVLKGILLVHYREFLQFTGNSLALPNFEGFLGLIVKNHKSPLWLAGLDAMGTSNDKTLRMTVIEMV